jgi:signal transduction histidine kinase
MTGTAASRSLPLRMQTPAIARRLLDVAAAALTAGVFVAVLEMAPADRRLPAAVAAGVTVGVPMGVGLLAWRAQADGRFPRLLVAIGAAFSLTALAHSSDATLYSLGRIAVWFVIPASLYLTLAFPSGRVMRAGERRILAGVAVLVGTLYLPTVLLAPEYPSPLPWTSCGVDCPPNAFNVVALDAGVIDTIRITREALATLAMWAVVVALVLRMRRATGLLRCALAPVVAFAVVQGLVFLAYQWARRSGQVPGVVDLLGWAWLYTVPVVALSFGLGLLHRRLHVASVIERLTWDLRAPASPHEVRGHLADALEDPQLRLVYRLDGEPGRWVDESGWPAALPVNGDGRIVTAVEMDGGLVAAVVHDEAVAADAKLVQSAASYALVVLDNTRLIDELRGSLQRLSESERQRVTAEARERQRIGRDLHDGAQQRLLALRINLGLLGERLDSEAPERAAELGRLATQIDDTIQDMRMIANALVPPVVAEAGIAEALRMAARDGPLDVVVRADGVGRFSPEIEKTVYFACMEAIQNAAKHARGATTVTVDLVRERELRFEVRDDGAGFNGANGHGSGLPNMTARMASVGGRVTIHSTPGHGTKVLGRIPLV